MIHEVHTSDLTDPCPRRVQLRHDGKVEGRCTTALYRGILAHAALEILHGAWDVGAVEIVTEAAAKVAETLASEGRPLTPTVARDQADIAAEVAEIVGHYRKRFADLFAASKVIGIEVPIRMTIEVDGEPSEFASHTDLLFRDPASVLNVWDWKSGDDDWSHAERSMQVGMYHVATAHGSVLLADEWVELQESPVVSIVDLNALKPYTRRTAGKDEAGNDHEFVKGDLRPLRSIVREVQVSNEAAILDEYALRVRMFRAGHFPTNPTSDGCRTCDSFKFCPSWNREPQRAEF